MSAKKMNLIDKRMVVDLEDQSAKINRQLVKLEKMLKSYAKISPVATPIKHLQSARKEIAEVMAFAFAAKQIVKNAEKLRA